MQAQSKLFLVLLIVFFNTININCLDKEQKTNHESGNSAFNDCIESIGKLSSDEKEKFRLELLKRIFCDGELLKKIIYEQGEGDLLKHTEAYKRGMKEGTLRYSKNGKVQTIHLP